MTYRNSEVGLIPSDELVKSAVAEFKCKFDYKDFIIYWRRKHWKTKKGVPLKSLEGAIMCYNSLFVQKQRELENLKAQGNTLFHFPDDYIPHIR